MGELRGSWHVVRHFVGSSEKKKQKRNERLLSKPLWINSKFYAGNINKNKKKTKNHKKKHREKNTHQKTNKKKTLQNRKPNFFGIKRELTK